jgi:hypothetical protein
LLVFYRELQNIYRKCHNHRHLHRWNKYIGIFTRVAKYLLKIPQLPTRIQTETFHRYFTESYKIFTWNATIIDVYTNGYSPSVLHIELKNIYYICHNHRRNISVSICPTGIIFLARIFPSVKPSVFIFFPIECGITGESYSDELFLSGI